MVERAISYREMISRFYPLVRLRTEHLLDAIDTQVARGPGPGPVGAGTALDFALLVDQLAECYVSAASIFDRRRRLLKSIRYPRDAGEVSCSHNIAHSESLLRGYERRMGRPVLLHSGAE